MNGCVRFETPCELTRQAALADARLADQQNEATAALAPRTLELLHKGVEFWPATDEWRLDLLGDSRRIDLDRLQAKPDAAAAPLHGVPDEVEDCPAEEDLPRLGRALESRCYSRDVAADEAVTGERLAGVDPDTELELVLCRDRLSQLRSSSYRPQGVVLVRLRNAEHAHQLLVGACSHPAFVVLDGRTRDGDATHERRPLGLGVELLGRRQCGRKHRYRLPALGRGRCVAVRGDERRLLEEDRPLELTERGARIEAELVGEPLAGLLKGPERVRLSSRPVEGEHELRAHPLVVRVRVDELLKRGTRSAWWPSASSASTRTSCAAARTSSSCAAADAANDSYARSARAGPRQSARAVRRVAARVPGASAARASATSCSNCPASV